MSRDPRRPLPPLDQPALERAALRYVERYATTRAKLVAYLTRKLRERGADGAVALKLSGGGDTHPRFEADARVAFVPGAPFYANDPATNTLRLSFVTVPPERIQEGIAVLGKLIKDQL